MLRRTEPVERKQHFLLNGFADKYWIENTRQGLEIHIHVPLEYESLWFIKIGDLTVEYGEACKLIGKDPMYLDKLDDQIEMTLEYADSYWRDRHEAGVEFHIQIPNNYEKLWTTKLAELTATDEEIEEYRDDVGSM
jgi:hypothetical protein